MRAEGIVDGNLERLFVYSAGKVEQRSCRRGDGNATKHLDITFRHFEDEVQNVTSGWS